MHFLLGIQTAAAVGVAATGLAASYTDLRERRVWNKHLLKAAGLGAALYLALALRTLLGEAGWSGGHWYTVDFFTDSAMHAGLGAAAAALLWRLGIWPSGDAKLFVILCALMPLADPTLPGFPGALTAGVLTNVFLPAGLFIVGETVYAVWHTQWRHSILFFWSLPGVAAKATHLARSTWESLKEAVRSRWETSHYGLWYLFFLFSGSLFDLLNHQSGQAVRILRPFASFGVYWAVNRLLEAWKPGPKTAAALFTAVGVAVYLHPALVVGRGAGMLRWTGLAVLIWLYFLCTSQLDRRRREYQWDSYNTPPSNLAQWMRLTRQQYRDIQNRDEYFYEAYFEGALYPDGLTKMQVKLLKAWCKRHEIETVEVQKIMPFAPWIFAGVVLTLLLRRDLMSVVPSFFGRG